MRVKVEHYEAAQHGIFRSSYFYEVRLEVQFSEEEKAIIKERRLENILLIDRDAPPTVNPKRVKHPHQFYLTVGDLLKGPDIFHFLFFHEAQNYQERIRLELANLKMHMEEAAEGLQDEEYEL